MSDSVVSPPSRPGAPKVQLPILRTDPTQLADEYLRLLHEDPVCPVSLATGDPAWLVTRHEDLKTVLSDRRFSRAAMCGADAPRSQSIRPHPDTILNMDPPRHTRLRKLVTQAFSPRRVEQLRGRIQEIVNELLDGMAAMTPPVDLNAAFGRPLPLRIACDLLGIPFEDQGTFLEWIDTIMTFNSRGEDIAKAYVGMRDYLTDLVASKRKDPVDDLLSELTQLSDEEGALTESEVISLGSILLVSGHETSITVMAASVLMLMRHPDQLAELRADKTLLPNAVEELLRLGLAGFSPYPRVAMTDVDLGGVTIPKGSAVVVHYETALRDPEIFSDPEVFNIHRESKSQVFFGHGPHFCLGSSIARAELQIGLWSLLERFPNLALAAPTESLKWKDFATLGGWEEFLLTWDKSAKPINDHRTAQPAVGN